jgi:hypothetical protein
MPKEEELKTFFFILKFQRHIITCTMHITRTKKKKQNKVTIAEIQNIKQPVFFEN